MTATSASATRAIVFLAIAVFYTSSADAQDLLIQEVLAIHHPAVVVQVAIEPLVIPDSPMMTAC